MSEPIAQRWQDATRGGFSSPREVFRVAASGNTRDSFAAIRSHYLT